MDEENFRFATIKHEGKHMRADRYITGPAFTGYTEFASEIPMDLFVYPPRQKLRRYQAQKEKNTV